MSVADTAAAAATTALVRLLLPLVGDLDACGGRVLELAAAELLCEAGEDSGAASEVAAADAATVAAVDSTLAAVPPAVVAANGDTSKVGEMLAASLPGAALILEATAGASEARDGTLLVAAPEAAADPGGATDAPLDAAGAPSEGKEAVVVSETALAALDTALKADSEALAGTKGKEAVPLQAATDCAPGLPAADTDAVLTSPVDAAKPLVAAAEA